MNKRKAFSLVLVALLTLPLFAGCIPVEQQKKQIQELLDVVKDDNIKNAVAQRIKDGLTAKDVLPPTSVMIMATLLPISAIVGFILILLVFAMYYNKRAMAMIEKGTYQQKPLNIRWDLIVLFVGVVLLFTGPGISLTMIGTYGVYTWSILGGAIPFLIGIAFMVFFFAYRKLK